MNSIRKSDIRTVLLHDWDPIGIADDPHAQDEYDAYIVPVMNLLTGSASQQCIADDLLQNEQNMGLEGDHVRALAVAAKLKALIQ